jgi:hypothetical protein
MTSPELEYEEACRAGDLAAHVARLSATELKRLHGYAAARVEQNGKKGGVPAIVKWACVLEGAERFLK